jgi:cysteine desulfurase
VHSQGLKSRKALDTARKQLASFINAEPEEIIFTSNATEANNSVFKSLSYDLIITSPTEHVSVIEPAKATGKPIIWLNIDKEGFIDLEELKTHLIKNTDKTILLSIMHGNNEIGTLQDIVAIGKLKAEFSNVIFHSDCVQTFAKHPIDVKAANIDLVSVSAHKVHAPKGVGFLYFSSTLKDQLLANPLILGSSQEFKLRGGTENLISIVLFAKALELKANSKTKELHQYFIDKLEAHPALVLNGPKDLSKRVLGNINLSLTNSKFQREEILLQLDLRGIAVATGSACTSANGAPDIQISYVLRACKIADEIGEKAIRVSLSQYNTKQEIDYFFSKIGEI